MTAEMSFLMKSQMLGQTSVNEFRAADTARHSVEKPAFDQDGAWSSEGSLAGKTLQVAFIRVHDIASLRNNPLFAAEVRRIVEQAGHVDLDDQTLDRIRAFDAQLAARLTQGRRMW